MARPATPLEQSRADIVLELQALSLGLDTLNRLKADEFGAVEGGVEPAREDEHAGEEQHANAEDGDQPADTSAIEKYEDAD